VTTTRPSATQVSFEVLISEVTVDRRGRERVTLVSTPRITALVGEEDTFVQSATVSENGGSVETTVGITLVYRE